jgi:hypothetical protein
LKEGEKLGDLGIDGTIILNLRLGEKVLVN